MVCALSAQIRWVLRHDIFVAFHGFTYTFGPTTWMAAQIGTGTRTKALSTQGGQGMRDNIANAFGPRTAEALMPLDASLGDIAKVSGYEAFSGKHESLVPAMLLRAHVGRSDIVPLTQIHIKGECLLWKVWRRQAVLLHQWQACPSTKGKSQPEHGGMTTACLSKVCKMPV